ncbi:MAG: flagellar hook basal-body protein, partial [Arcobacteraceae bacterium]|nr:flagellar hook basal-body protein [Arcobacteraceae bacterium]
MVGALWTGISGLAGQQTALDNESNNIANVNTIGYKSSRISFADQMYQNKIGKGAQVLDAEKMYTQGNLKVTGVNYDVALAGDGFFAVSNTRGGGTSEIYYTRAGNFRMGDSGKLNDASGNDVQGWAMSTEPIVESSNPNISIFTNDYTKMLSSKIISYSSAVETITAKATDFTITAKDDNESVFSGAGLKTKYGKIADVEELVKAYTNKLQALKDDPNSSSASAASQSSHIDLPNQGTSDAVSKDGDEVYIYIDGNKVSQTYLSADTTEEAYRKTMKAFSDKISNIAGIKAYVAEENSPYNSSTADSSVNNGVIRIESLIPGQQFTISSTGMVHEGNDKPGTYNTDIVANPGKGLGALESVRDALNKAITGKQTDVYTTSDLGRPDGIKDYTYSITIYDKGQEQNVDIGPISISNPADIDAIVADINNKDLGGTGVNELPTYIRAENINGSLVIQTLDSNFDVEYSGDLTVSEYGYTNAPEAAVGIG